MSPDLASIAETLSAIREENAELRRRQDEIFDLLQQLYNPAASLGTAAKSKMIIEATRSGDRKRLRETLAIINS